jgi:PucR C-terminal helix-turn-helix domain/GGDEF-like domain
VTTPLPPMPVIRVVCVPVARLAMPAGSGMSPAQLTGRTAVDDAIATELGYQADGEFMVACVAGLGRRDAADRLTEALHPASRRVTCTYHEGHVVVVAQGLTAAQIRAAVDTFRPTARIGTGIPRPGLAGAAVSLRDAQEAVERTNEDRRMVQFEHDWLMSCLKAIKPRFEAILQPTMAVARRHPDLAETVRAYSSCRYSVSACARQLHIHPNSARYRLDRWKALTGHDIETAPGLTASLIALELMS